MDIKYIFKKDSNEYYFIENAIYDEEFLYPLFKAKTSFKLEFNDIKVEILNYPLPVLKIHSKDNEAVNKILHKWLEYSDFLSDIVAKYNTYSKYVYGDYIYIVLKNSQFKILEEHNKVLFNDKLSNLEELGVISISEKLSNEILELDQNLQSCISLDLMLELMEENLDLKKYIEYIKANVKDEDLNGCFFFDEYVYNMFASSFLEVLNDIAPFKNDQYGRVAMMRFIEYSLTGSYHDECRCFNV